MPARTNYQRGVQTRAMGATSAVSVVVGRSAVVGVVAQQWACCPTMRVRGPIIERLAGGLAGTGHVSAGVVVGPSRAGAQLAWVGWGRSLRWHGRACLAKSPVVWRGFLPPLLLTLVREAPLEP